MKVIKRDGRAVDYNREKIEIAIQKANEEVTRKERITKEEIRGITKYIEELDKKRILVEDIQDIIEQQLMDLKKFELAKKYMIYRYTRALVRKANTTDESILGLIKNQNKELLEENSNKNAVLASTQRDYIAGLLLTTNIQLLLNKYRRYVRQWNSNECKITRISKKLSNSMYSNDTNNCSSSIKPIWWTISRC